MSQREPLLHRRDLEALIIAGNELAVELLEAQQSLADSSHVLEQWADAKRRVMDPYGAHLRDVVDGAK